MTARSEEEAARRSMTRLMAIERDGLHETILRELDAVYETGAHFRYDATPGSTGYTAYLDGLILATRRLTYVVECAIRYPSRP